MRGWRAIVHLRPMNLQRLCLNLLPVNLIFGVKSLYSDRYDT